MRAAVITFLCLCLLLQPDSTAASSASTNSNNQCLVSTILNQALQMQQLSTQVLQQGSQLQEQASQLQEQASQLQEQASQLQQQSSQLQQLHSLEQKVTLMESELKEYSMSMSILEMNNSHSKQVAFSARFKDRKIINVGKRGTLKYDDIITNIGGGYSPVTGHFTAPHTGIYAFFTSLRSSNHHQWIALAIFKGEQSLTEVIGNGRNDPWDKGTALVTTHMNKGEIAYVRQVKSGTFLEAGALTTFSGILLAAD